MYADGEQVSVRLTGGGPYGLRLGGGKRWEPVVVSKLHRKSKARSAGVKVGDVVLSINGSRCHGMSLDAANDLIDYSPDLHLQLLRVSEEQIQVTTSSSSFRQSQQPSSRSLTASPYHSGSESTTSHNVLSDTTELFRHKVYHQHQPQQPSIRQWRTSWTQSLSPQSDIQRVEKTGSGENEKLVPSTETKSGLETNGWREILGGKSPSLQFTQTEKKSVSVSFLPKPIFSTKAQRWQPPPIASQNDSVEVEPAKYGSRIDGLVHEVVIWSSKQTEVNEQRQKQFTWQPPQQQSRSAADGLPESSPWQPIVESSGTTVDKTTENASHLWQPQQNRFEPVRESSDKMKSSQPSQHRWQPTQPPVTDEVDWPNQSSVKQDLLQEPKRPPQDGSSSPVVTSLFLTRVVTDGGVLASGNESDADLVHDPRIANKRLYADSSFYEDPEHKYPTIVEQIKMARKVALLLTSPANKNARGQKMFLKRKEQSPKWVTDISSVLGPSFNFSPPTSEGGRSKSLGPGEVEEMRYHGEKSRHDVIPFDVCSMLAAELREEKGRGGRMFAKRRDQADASILSDVFIDVPDRPKPRRENNRKFVPPSGPPAAAPTRTNETDRRLDDGHSGLSLPVVNRLKDMVDLPKPRISPWDSAEQYGTVEPAFEHLRNYRPYGGTPKEPEVLIPEAGPLLDFTTKTTQDVFSQASNPAHQQRAKVAKSWEPTVQSTTSGLNFGADSTVTGFDARNYESGFLRQAAATSKGYHPVNFQVGARSFI